MFNSGRNGDALKNSEEKRTSSERNYFCLKKKREGGRREGMKKCWDPFNTHTILTFPQ